MDDPKKKKADAKKISHQKHEQDYQKRKMAKSAPAKKSGKKQT